MSTPRNWLSIALPLVAVLLLHVADAAHLLSQIAFVATYAIAGLGVVLIVGQSGQISLGQGAVLGVGAYTQTLLVARGLAPLAALPLSMLCGALAGWIASLPARRLGGLYFGMSTLAFALIVEETLVRAEPLTRGAAGLAVGRFEIAGWSASTPTAQALVSLVALALALFCCRRWVDSRVGRAWRAVRDDEVAAAACGIDTGAVKLQVFVLGGALAGLAGALYAHWIAYVSPEQFGLQLSFELLILAFIGGVARLSGAIWGALVLVAIPQLLAVLRDHLPERIAQLAGLDVIVLGMVIVAVMLWRPQGLAGR